MLTGAGERVASVLRERLAGQVRWCLRLVDIVPVAVRYDGEEAASPTFANPTRSGAQPSEPVD